MEFIVLFILLITLLCFLYKYIIHKNKYILSIQEKLESYSNVLTEKDETIKDIQEKYIHLIKEFEKESKKEKHITFWIIDKPTDDDVKILESNTEFVSLMKKFIAYEIFKKTDVLRTIKDNNDINQFIWRLNQLHEIFFMLYNIEHKHFDINDSE